MKSYNFIQPVTDLRRKAEVLEWRERYDATLAHLGQIGAEVFLERAFLLDNHTLPGRFVKNAVHQFVLPKQSVQEVMNITQTTAISPGVTLKTEMIRRVYDRAAARDVIELQYDDSGEDKVEMSILSRKGQELPDDLIDRLQLPLPIMIEYPTVADFIRGGDPRLN
jgi:hypothetical protein